MLTDEFRPNLLALLDAADLGVADIELKKMPNELPTEAREIFTPEFLEEIVLKRSDAPAPVAVQLKRDGWSLPPEYESRGTHVLLARIADLVELRESGGLYIVDELDTGLHPDLCRELVRMFTDEDWNLRGAQLLFSTHCRDLLESLRSDEVLLVEKDASGASRVYAASEFRDVRARDDLARVYRQGRLGGLPVLGGLSRAMSENHGVPDGQA